MSVDITCDKEVYTVRFQDGNSLFHTYLTVYSLTAVSRALEHYFGATHLQKKIKGCPLCEEKQKLEHPKLR